MTDYITTAQAKERGLLAGRKARCSCGCTLNSDASDSGWKELPFLEYWGPGSQKAAEQCTCGYYRAAHTPTAFRGQGIPCKEFRVREPDEHDHFYCGCRGWD